ncbi:protein S100-A11 [Solea solea]|uniref:protein S100-A11 n=1 Tax=Solea solea TaxID=90069 RepID=UPI00272DA2AB|nr:protein S100-A11 [Solea solea]
MKHIYICIFREVASVRKNKDPGTCSLISNTTGLRSSAQTVMEAAIDTLVSQFKVFAGKDGSAGTLSKDEFQSLMNSQLPNCAKDLSIDQLMGSLDENNDGELTFSEFWQLIGKLASQRGGFSQ